MRVPADHNLCLLSAHNQGASCFAVVVFGAALLNGLSQSVGHRHIVSVSNVKRNGNERDIVKEHSY